MEMTLDDVDGIAKGHFLWQQAGLWLLGAKKGGTPPGTPQHHHHITAQKTSQHFALKNAGFSVMHHYSGSYL